EPRIGGIQQFFPVRLFRRPDGFIRVNVEDPIAGGPAQRLIARSGKIVAPWKFGQPRAEGKGDVFGGVGRAGVDDNDLVDGIAKAAVPTSRFTKSRRFGLTRLRSSLRSVWLTKLLLAGM